VYEQCGRRPQRATGDDQEIAEQDVGIDVGLGNADRQRDTGKAQAEAGPLRRAQPLAEERSGVEKHRRTRGRGKQKAAIDQHELDAEDDACYQVRPQRAVALEEPDSTQPPDDQ
jgi:hypothetical protein